MLSRKDSKAASPRFGQGGPDAQDYGASQDYPIGNRATCYRSASVALAFFVGCYSHFDQVGLSLGSRYVMDVNRISVHHSRIGKIDRLKAVLNA
jgi:hypothetical protein